MGEKQLQLAVNKPPSKPKKGSSAAAAAATSMLKVYTTDPAGFRDLVQHLTGMDSHPPPPTGPSQTTGTSNAVSRLHRMAPPPLGFRAEHQQKQQQEVPPASVVSPGILLSPVPTLTPAEWSACWSENLLLTPTQNSPTAAAVSAILHNEESKVKSEGENDLQALPLSPTFLSPPLSPLGFCNQRSRSPRCSGDISPSSLSSLLALPSPGSFTSFELELGSF